jgi:signal transduction histidine kinase
MSRVSRLIDWFAAPIVRIGDAGATRRARLIVVCCAFGAVVLTIYSLIHLFLFRYFLSGGVLGLSALATVAAPFLLRLTGSNRLVANGICTVLLTNVFFITWIEGGLRVPVLMWTLPLAILGPSLLGTRATVLWTLVCCAGYVSVYLAIEKGWSPQLIVAPATARRLDLAVMLGLMTVTTALTIILEGLLNKSIREKASVEEKLRQAQKLENIGLIAGGVAHDFNNLLSVVLTYANLLRDEMSRDDPRYSNVERISVAAQRAADLTRQLLQFSRKDIVQPETFDLNDVVRELADLLQRSLGETIELRFEPEPGLRLINADRKHLQQVLLNLAINARDAMDNGGIKHTDFECGADSGA